MLTCSPGDELYSAYGHSAIRLCDSKRGIDVVFNYGTFDFNTPFFYLKFLNGTLDYMLSAADYSSFLKSYQREGRGVVESEFVLSTTQKSEIERLLIDNLNPERRFYRYDFFFDNCATRIRDIVFRATSTDVVGIKSNKEAMTYRDCLHEKVGANEWSGFGIDIILGVRADQMVSVYEKAMLPDHLATLMRNLSLTRNDNVLLERKAGKMSQPALTPAICAVMLLAVVIVLSLIEARGGRWFFFFDVSLAALLSLLSVLLWYLWLVSEIKITSYNLNVLWASILYVPLLYAILKRNAKLLTIISTINILLLAIFFVVTALGVQYASTPIVIIAVALTARNVILLRRAYNGFSKVEPVA